VGPPTAPPGLVSRLLSLLSYLGLAPVLSALRVRWDDPFRRHHRDQALALLLILQVGIVLELVLEVGSLYFFPHFPRLTRALVEARWLGYVVLGVLLAWALTWAVAVLLALAGSSWGLPLVRRLARSRRWIRVSFAGNALALVGLAAFAGVATHAVSLTRQRGPAAVYLLYDDDVPVPRWLYAVGMYRLSLKATDRWGPGSVVLAPLSEETLQEALAHGRMVVLATHGSDGLVTASSLVVGAPKVEGDHDPLRMRCLLVMQDGEKWETARRAYAGPHLQLVYLSACDAGEERSRWCDRLTPAEVITFDRISSASEHVWWLLFEAPGRLQSIRDEAVGPALPAGVAGQGIEAWPVHSSREGRFEARMPPGVVVKKPALPKVERPIATNFTTSAPDGEVRYSVAYCDYDREVAIRTGGLAVLAEVRDDQVTQLKGKLLAEKRADLGPHPGREFLIGREGGAYVRMWIVLADHRRLYYVAVFAPSREAAYAEPAEKFFASFRLTE
jgi:hypothetical protein